MIVYLLALLIINAVVIRIINPRAVLQEQVLLVPALPNVHVLPKLAVIPFANVPVVTVLR